MKDGIANKHCLNCGHEFAKKERLQSAYRFFWRMKCKECGTEYSVQIKYRLLFGLLCALPIVLGPNLVIFFQWSPENALFFQLAYLLVILVPALLLIPRLPVRMIHGADEL